jgi:hypothetical protein
MAGIERQIYGYDAVSDKIYKKEKAEEAHSETKKYPAYKVDAQTGDLSEIKAKEEKNPRYSKRLLKAIALGSVLSAGVIAWMSDKHESDVKEKIISTTIEHDTDSRKRVFLEQAALKAEEENVTREVFFSPREEKIILNNAKEKELVDLWMHKYRTNPKLRNSLVSGFKEMGKWQDYLEPIFKEEGVPTEYMYLALAESHWQTQAVSRAGATGPYQFMPETAKLYDLQIGDGLNESKDPLKSARACAQLLHDLHQACGDWNLALAGYNGPYLWRYIKNCKTNGEAMSHEHFLKYLEGEINNVKNGLAGKEFRLDIIHNNKSVKYWAERYHLKPHKLCELIGIAHGAQSIPDSIKSVIIKGEKHPLEIKNHNNEINYLAKKYRLGPTKLCQIIGIPENSKRLPDNIKSITIPMSQLSEVKRHQLLDYQIRGLNENEKYPAKGIAINKLIKEGAVKEQEPTIKFKEVVIKQPQQNKPEGVKKTGKKKKRKQHMTGYVSLTVVARNYGNTLKEISELNPGLELGARIPDGYKVRIRG